MTTLRLREEKRPEAEHRDDWRGRQSIGTIGGQSKDAPETFGKLSDELDTLRGSTL